MIKYEQNIQDIQDTIIRPSIWIMGTEREKKYKIKSIFNKAKAKKNQNLEGDGYADTRSL